MSCRETLGLKGAVFVVLAAAVACGGSTFESTSSDGGADEGGDGASGDAAGSGDAGDASRGDSASGDAGRVPLNHRPDDSQCSAAAPAGDCTIMGSPGGGGSCSSDSQCTAGTNGRCEQSTGGAIFCRCTYDTCTHDTDCPSGQLCACHGSPYSDGDGNTCTMGNCRVDSDCGAGGYCSPSVATGGCGGLGGYYCHTPSDTCLDDTDCTSSQGSGVCEWSSTAGHWACAPSQLCP